MTAELGPASNGGSQLRTPHVELSVRQSRLLSFAWRAGVSAFSIVGWALLVWTMVTLWSGAGFDAHGYREAAKDLLQGVSPYSGTYGDFGAFRYAPPLVVLFTPAALIPFDAFKVMMLVLNVAALRYAVGSWRWAGLVLVHPWSIHAMYLLNVNFPIAAALYAAFRSSTGPLALAGLAKISPFLAVPQLLRSGRRITPFLLTMTAAVALTLPVPWLWPAWVTALLTSAAPAGALHIAVDPRVAVAVGLLAIAWYRRTDWMAALAAAISIPVLWPSTLVVFLAPLRLWVEQMRRPARSQVGGRDGPLSV